MLTITTVSDMIKRSLFLKVFIFYIYVKIIQCNELPPCYNQPAESCPLPNKCKCVKTGDSALFCCQLQSNEDFVKNFECSGIEQIIIKYTIFTIIYVNQFLVIVTKN